VADDINVVSDVFVSNSLVVIPTMTEWGMIIFSVDILKINTPLYPLFLEGNFTGH